ncbi:type II toxin-antitoxin system VapC family toxin [Oscillatoria laete-virens NRMC-F 0139]|nr:type II toxin-antitoxin system VapC family toxin [Oscillatoria laete-virens]MDL5054174.1 type II toxin-antitoxin system VapC family toxin [Oscillatoria laete-virens NRMC-F 0139]
MDTNALSAYADGDANLQRILNQAIGLYLPVVVLGEYSYGLMSSKERKSREKWLDELLNFFQTLDVNRQTARHYAEIRHELRLAGRPIPENDIWIAALSRQTGFAILTRDDHFSRITGIEIISW